MLVSELLESYHVHFAADSWCLVGLGLALNLIGAAFHFPRLGLSIECMNAEIDRPFLRLLHLIHEF